MIEGITPISSGKIGLAKPASINGEEQVNFGNILDKAIGDVNDLQKTADNKIAQFAAGEVADPHEVMIAMEEASIALQYTMQIRNKIIDAYQEIMRMQV